MSRPVLRYIVYVLIDPRDGRIRYVGKCKWGLTRIERAHLSLTGTSTTPSHVGRWIRQLFDLGLKPDYLVAEEFETEHEMDVGEARWQARCWCLSLTNERLEDGSRSSGTYTEEGFAKRSAQSKANWAKMRERGYKRPPMTEEQKAKIRAFWAARPKTPPKPRQSKHKYTAEQLSARIKEQQNRPEVKAKKSASLRASFSDPEVKKRRSEAFKLREQKKRLRRQLLGVLAAKSS